MSDDGSIWNEDDWMEAAKQMGETLDWPALDAASQPARWVCRKCGSEVRSETRPSPYNCPVGGFHNWEVQY